MKLYYVPQTRSSRVRWLLEELEVPYEMERLDVAKKQQRSPEYLKIHPLGHVPALQDGEMTMFESAAIVAYLADKYPEKGFAPAPDSPLRGPYYQWMFFAMAELEPHVANVAFHTVQLPEEKRVPAVAEAARKSFTRNVRALDEALEGKSFLVGDRLTAADVVVGGVVGWARMLGLLADFPRVEAWSKSLAQRPAAKRARAD